MKLTDLHNLSKVRLEGLSQAGIHSTGDLLFLFPRKYLDKSKTQPISTLKDGKDPVMVVGRVDKIHVSGYGNKRRLEVHISDHSGTLKAVWFKGWRYFISLFNEGELVSFFGKVKRYGRMPSMAHPEAEILESPDDAVRYDYLIPIYPGNQHFIKASITNQLLSNWIHQILSQVRLKEFLPDEILKDGSFPRRDQAFHLIHHPSTKAEAAAALERFKYEELFLFELGMAQIKQTRRVKASGHLLQRGPKTNDFLNKTLPFQLTEGQQSALAEIEQDLLSGYQMNRLIQGDVGAGKTVVAIGAMLMAVDSGFQAVLMAPTEILAEQHFQTLSTYLKDSGIRIRFLRGNQKKALREDILTDISGGHCNIVVGTHAVIQEGVRFHKLGLAVIDEQHRFGVKQRNQMMQKGDSPHLLVMSATPIPRSLAMTIYSDLDISIIKGLPGGRKEVKTAVRTEKDRSSIDEFIERTVNEGGQVYVVYPLIEESEVLDLKDATMGFEKMKKRFSDIDITLLHGRMDPQEKELAMKRFVSGESRILVSTTVIEVGVDVPNASLMIIEQAERFGLSQLHQLRGRIGRGERQSFCILIPGEKLSQSGRFRLRKMTETSDGFEIAEADLKLRGPGDFLGTKQSGLPEFRFADIVEDRMLLERAKNDAWRVMSEDSRMETPKYAMLKRIFDPYFAARRELFGV
ncbi:MAG: ATP-dependent DNA helicase RecG [Bacteroidetes bacterium]|nr:MAG: ATP-dependent DNA helicase RecG [Bacteroidota bacterium]